MFVIKAQVEAGALNEAQPFLHTVQVGKVSWPGDAQSALLNAQGEGECGMRISWPSRWKRGWLFAPRMPRCVADGLRVMLTPAPNGGLPRTSRTSVLRCASACQACSFSFGAGGQRF